MSYASRSGENANSALLVQVDQNDTGSGVFDGLAYQEALEKAAYEVSNSYKAPAQLASDFLAGKVSDHFGSVKPTYELGTVFADFNTLLPAPLVSALKDGLMEFEQRVPGFIDDAILTGVETRSSSSIRILRDKRSLESEVKGLYPCGEGAGYSGGIMTSAIDGLKCAMALMDHFDKPQDGPIQ